MAKARKRIEKDLLTSMGQAAAFAKGARKSYRVHEFTSDHVRLIRATTKKSQPGDVLRALPRCAPVRA